MPVALVSAGINKIIAILIAIRTHRGGVVLIDEIENGIYFGMFPSLWETLYRFAKDNSTQLFLSSHSLECLRAATETMNKNSHDFSLIQVENRKWAEYRRNGGRKECVCSDRDWHRSPSIGFPSMLINKDFIILCEGPADRIFLGPI